MPWVLPAAGTVQRCSIASGEAGGWSDPGERPAPAVSGFPTRFDGGLERIANQDMFLIRSFISCIWVLGAFGPLDFARGDDEW